MPPNERPVSKYQESARAKRDLKAIFDYIADNSSEERAEAYLKKLEKTFNTLADSPDMGTPRDYTPPGVLAFAKDDYMIYYRKKAPTIEIFRVIHGSRNMKKRIKQ